MLHQIGIGALGPVFRTYEPTRDRLVAVKVFRLDIVPEQVQALAEALSRATSSSLFHPSIVEPIAAGVEGTLAYRAEEYVAAESLDVAMRHYAPAAVEKALPFITQLAGAIDFARAAGVGHGGLHPRDILVTPDEARATGFGVVEALEQVGIRAPTRRPYAAPERIAGAAWSTPADVFSLAAITFELLTARRPSGTGVQIGALPDGEHSAAIHAVLARAMDDDPARRHTTALAFAAALEGAATGSVPGPLVPTSSVPTSSVPASEVPVSSVHAPSVVAHTDLGTDDSGTDDLGTGDRGTRSPSPGEFEVEKELDPVLAAIDDDMAGERDLDEAAVAERTLFDDDDEAAGDEGVHENVHEDEPAEALADLGEVEPERFADEFVAEQAAEAESRRPLEAVHETVVPVAHAAEAPMYVPTDPERDADVLELAERSRPAILPLAVTLVIGLLVGFGACYFLLSRGRLALPQDAAPVATGPATPEKPGQYSEQKVTAPPPSVTAPPPVPIETPAPAAVPPPARRPAATRGRVVVTSTPSRASVTINGTWRGRTPLTVDNLAFGRYVVRVVQPGYAVAKDEFTLSARDASHEFTPRLERETSARPSAPPPAPRAAAPAPRTTAPPAPAGREAFTGSLFVDSRPRGATVFVDGRSVGQTPLSLPDVSVGSHIVRLELTGKKTWTASTLVIAGQTARVTGSLEDK